MKYLIVWIVSAGLMTTGILATGGQLDLATVFAVLAASCLPVGLAYEYRAELWPTRRRKIAALAPTPTAACATARRPAFLRWTPTASPRITPAVLDDPRRA